MPKPPRSAAVPTSGRVPSYRLHRPSGRAVVTLDGRDHYLGAYGSAESRAEYDRLLTEWLANGRSLARPSAGHGVASDVTVDELVLGFVRWAEAHYRKNGRPTGEAENVKAAMKPLRRLYGPTPASAFGPKALKAVRTAMAGPASGRSADRRRAVAGLCRNGYCWRIRRAPTPPGPAARIGTTGSSHAGSPPATPPNATGSSPPR